MKKISNFLRSQICNLQTYLNFCCILIVSFVFVPGDENKHKVLKKNAVPSIFSFTKRKLANPLAQKWSDRVQERSRKKLCFETADDPIPGPSGIQSQNKHEAQFRDEQLPVQMEIDIHPHIELLGNDQPCSSTESKTTQVDFEHIYGSIERYKDKDSVIAFYTGFETYAKFFFVFSTLSPMAHLIKYYGSKEAMSKILVLKISFS